MMAGSPPDKPPQSSGRYLYVLGLAAMGIGLLLILSVAGPELRPVGGVMVLLGAVLTGSYFIRRLKAEMSSGSGGPEPAWHKPAHGAAGYGSPMASRDAVASYGAASPDALKGPEAGKPPSPPEKLQATTSPAPPAAVAAETWAAPVFDEMSAKQFGEMCEALLAQGGFETLRQPHGLSGGVVVWLHSRNTQAGSSSPVSVALCRHWRDQPVDVPGLQALLELMAARQLKRGTCVTSSSFTERARQFAKLRSIHLLDRAALLTLIARRTPAQQQALLALARSGDQVSPP